MIKKILIISISFILILIFGFYFSFIDYESYNTQEVNFVINKPYLSVVKSLATKESLEKTVEDGNGRLRSKNWQSFVVEVPKKILRIKEYKLEGKLDFVVEKEDDSLGRLVLPFEQNVSVDKDIFHIKTNLKEPQKNVTLYNKAIEITPSLEDHLKTQVSIKNEIKIKKFIPFFLKDFMNKKVEKTNKEDLENLRLNLLRSTQDVSPIVKFKF
jgi:ABC-type sugar transport system permease subunit